jgi:hypothetical protein
VAIFRKIRSPILPIISFILALVLPKLNWLTYSNAVWLFALAVALACLWLMTTRSAQWRIGRWERKYAWLKNYRNWGIVLACMVVFLAVGLPWHMYGAKTEEIVSISPKEIPIEQLPYTTYGSFVVHNNQADKTKFNVWVVATFNDCIIDLSHIALNSPTLERATIPNLSSVPISLDYFGLAGNNTKNQQVICLFIRQLVPSETCTFTLSVEPTANDIVGENASMVLNISGYSDEPWKMIGQGETAVYQQFKPPINMTVTTIFVYSPPAD